MEIQSKGLAYWADGLAGREQPTDECRDALRTHPNFVDACKYIERSLLALSESGRDMARLMGDFSGMLYGIFVLYMDARGGLTRSSIEQFCEENGLSSPGRAAALLFQLRIKGYVIRDPSPHDRRVRRYVPAPALRDAVREVFLCTLRAFALVEPEMQEFIDRIDEPELYREFLLAMGDGAASFTKRGDRTPITLFAERNFGMQVLFSIVQSGAEGDAYPPKGPVRASVAELTKRFPISRSHVMKLLRDAEREGLLQRHAEEDGKSYLTENLRDALTHFHSGMSIGHAMNAHVALQKVERSKHRPQVLAS